MNVRRVVDNHILKNTRKCWRPEAVFLGPRSYSRMKYELLVYLKRTAIGGHICNCEMIENGIENFIYQGVAICLRAR